jgi:hypothetical protein
LRYPNEDGTYPSEDEPNGTPPETLSVNGETNLFRATHNFATNDPIETFSVKPSDDSRIDEEDLDWEFWDDEEESDTFCSGCHANVMLDISDCTRGGKMNIKVEISAQGTGFSVSAKREFFISCQADSTETAPTEFKGSGQFRYLEGTLSGKTLRAWYLDGGKIQKTDKYDAADGNQIKLNKAFNPSISSIFAIEFVSEGWYFLRDTWNSGSCNLPDSSETAATKMGLSDFCTEISNCSNIPSFCPS